MFSKMWWLSTIERAVKSGAQGYIALWMLTAGLADTSAQVPNADAFNSFFTMTNLKAALVMAVLSVLTSLGSTPVGPDKGAPSVVVTETVPTSPPV